MQRASHKLVEFPAQIAGRGQISTWEHIFADILAYKWETLCGDSHGIGFSAFHNVDTLPQHTSQALTAFVCAGGKWEVQTAFCSKVVNGQICQL